MLTIRNRLHLCWGLHDLHDLMTSWPHDHMTTWPHNHFTKQVVCSFEAPAIAATQYWQTKGLIDRNLTPISGFNSGTVPLTFCPMYHSTDFIFIIGTETELRRKSVLIPFRFRWLFHFIIGYIKDGVPVLLSFTEEHPRIGIAISKLVALLSPRRSSTW